MRSIRQKLVYAKRKLQKSTEDTKAIIQGHDGMNIKALKTQKAKLEMNLQEFRRLVEELENDNSDKLDETQLEKEFEELEDMTDSAQTTLIELDSCLQSLEAQLEKEEKLRIEQIQKEEKLRIEQMDRDERHAKQEKELELQLKRMQMEQENERIKLALEEKLEMERLQLERMKIEGEKETKASEVEARLRSQNVERRQILGASPVKLPKLELTKFDGNILKWQEFWDSFNATIHSNPSLQDVDKLNYLRAQLRYEAKDVVSGLEVTGTNYPVAVDLLKERYGKKQLMVNAHYSQLRDLSAASTYYEKLRSTFDQIERHVRSLQSLGENVENQFMVSLIQSKLPRNILAKLEEYKNNDEPWTVEQLRKELKKYISAQEVGDRLVNLYRKTGRTDADRNQGNWRDSWKKTPYQTKPEQYSTGVFTAGEKNRQTCYYCGKNHWSDECREYPDIKSRKTKASGCCFICLKKGHFLRDCKSNKPCVYCKKSGNHHRSLCPKQFTTPTEVSNASVESPEFNLVAAGEQVIMKTALIDVANPNDDQLCETEKRVFLDSGSQRTYILEELANKLQLKPTHKNFLTVFTFGTTKPKHIETPVVDVKILLRNGFTMNIKANVVPHVTGSIERRPIKSNSVKKKLEGYELADTIPSNLENCTIDLLIGNDYYDDIVSTKRIILQDSLYLLGSKFGWILSGRTQVYDSTPQESSLLMLTNSSSQFATQFFGHNKTDETLLKEPDMEDFWKLETIGIKDSPIISDDDKALKEFNNSIQNVDGRYQVRWPWREENPDLPDNYKLSYGRLTSVVKRLRDNPALLKMYDDIIKEQIKKGIIEKVDKGSIQGELKHYVPHHAVITPNKSTTKLRIVYDASAKVKKNNLSLNECLYRGPVFMEDLCALLLRFRTHRVAIVADIEKAFLQVGLQEKDRDVTRFLWIKDKHKPVTPENIDTFRFTRIPFGVISSQFILAATILYHLHSKKTDIAKMIARDLYVDNLITGGETDERGSEIYYEAKEMFKEMSMNLREWGSNSNQLQNIFKKEDRCTEREMKVLGLLWDLESDKISVPTKKLTTEAVYTKRQILKETAAVFDPLGYFSPILLNAKLLLRDLWQNSLEWDETIGQEQIDRWKTIQKDLHEIKHLKIPRLVGNTDCQLICFTDASGKAYGVTIYLRCIQNGSVTTNLIFSKSRIAPSKHVSLPRLELIAVLIGTRSLKFVEKSLQLQIKKQILWTDSQCVLHWIKSNKMLSAFVKRRIDEIKSHGEIEYRYVSTDENPADISSRGISTMELKNKDIWWYGPQWLNKEQKSWPTWNVEIVSKEIIDEITNEVGGPKAMFEVSAAAGELLNLKTKTLRARTDGNKQGKDCTPYGIDLQKFSSLTKLLRVTAWVQRFINNIKSKCKSNGPLTHDEINEAKIKWIKCIQCDFMREIQTDVTKQNIIVTTLGLKEDENEIIRCHGRLANAEMAEEVVSPIFLPKNSYWSKLLIDEFHKKLFHAGVSHTLSQIRNRYWIPQGRNMVRSVILRCGICRKQNGGPFKMPKMSPWPAEKLCKSAPFTYTGLDYLGPFYVKGQPTKKVWICLFTCVVVRAIHLEIVDDMTAEQFLMALRRFISRRGTPAQIILDNAPQFKLTKTTVDKAWQSIIVNKDIYDYTSQMNIKWKFIIEFAPWMGGFYERLVGIVKSSLRKAIGKRLLTKTQFITIVTESEGIINTRPLVYVGDDINSANAITPMHFLSLIPKNGTPSLIDHDGNDPDYKPMKDTSAEKLLETWKKGQIHLNNLWKTWYNEYLLSLRERYQTHFKQPRIKSAIAPQVGQIVHIKENLPRGSWKMGRITELINSQDGEIRAASVRLPTGNQINRPINLLYPLETAPPIDEQLTKKVMIVDEQDDTESNYLIERPRRKAAGIARDMLKALSLDEVGTFVCCRECRESREL